MPILRLTDATIRLSRKAGLPLVRMGTMAPDRTWSVPVSGEVAKTVERSRITGESDEGVVSRLVLHLWENGDVSIVAWTRGD